MGKLTYGPVSSRRFGVSLGVDVVPFKTCTLDCVYCQLGPTDVLTIDRRPFFPQREVVREVLEAIGRGPRPDVITFAGSGEPTLYSDLGAVARALRREAGIPLNLITNGTLLWRDDVAEDAAEFDIVAPDLDAADAATFAAINGPHPALDLGRVIDGIARFSARHPGKVRLEVFLLAGINDGPEALAAIVKAAALIAPAVVELNTAVRPTPGRSVQGLGAADLSRIAALFDPPAVPPAVFRSRSDASGAGLPRGLSDRILATLKRRPCTVGQLADALGAPFADVQAAAAALVAAGTP
ncbi:MAG: radical SAM protein, partial [Deltaproteobacteria bacterium]|nr:radical SAM protein [Deltaproteobacteria bacterium]